MLRPGVLTVPLRSRVSLLSSVLVAALSACDDDARDHPSSAGVSEFSLAVVARIELEDSGEAPLGEIGTLAVATNGDLLVGDRLIPRVLRYDRAGRLVARFGAFGDGPYEFRRVGGLLEDRSGRVLVVDPRRGRLTALNADLLPDTSFRVMPVPAGPVLRLKGSGYLMKTVAGRRSSGIALMNEEWVSRWRIPAPVPASAQGNPYWGSYATTEFAASTDFIVAAYSFQYPIQVYDRRGEAKAAIGDPPPSFRPAPVLQPGALAGPNAEQRRDDWLSSFTVIANLAVIEDSLLAVTHGSMRELGGAGRVIREHHSVDIYRLPTGVKIAEDIRLPVGSRVMMGRREGLYVVSSRPPDPWTVSVLRLIR